MDLYIPVDGSLPVISPYANLPLDFANLHIGYLIPFNLYFLTPDVADAHCPWNVNRYPGATITMQLKQDNVAALATQSTWTEVVPAWNGIYTATVTVTIASPGVITWTAHGFSAGQAVVFQTTGALPTGLVANQVYYVTNPLTNTFQVSATFNGPAINTSGSQSGTHTGFAVTQITRINSGTSTKGEYDRIQLAAPLGSGSFLMNLRGGVIQIKGGVSASARIYPSISSPASIEAAFARMVGSPYSVEIVSSTLIDVHGSACPGTAPFIQEVNVSDSNFLFGWNANLDLTGVSAGAAGTPLLYLIVLLTPSGGVQQRVLKLPVNLFA
jgi:hypothetical protein